MGDTPQQLLCNTLASNGITECGIIAEGDAFLALDHDVRGAPFAIDEGGNELRNVLVSITDEGPARLLAWACVPDGSTVLGIGIDLASTDDWPEDEHGDRFARLLFTDVERKLISIGEGPVPLRRAKVFSAKEAAFKATAAPLRRWYEEHEEELFFEARDFELMSWKESHGAGRRQRAAIACEKLGIKRIEVSFAEYSGMAFCVAAALGKDCA